MQLGKSQFGRQIKGKFQSVLLKQMPTPGLFPTSSEGGDPLRTDAFSFTFFTYIIKVSLPVKV
jgi:hypothetical protein